MNTANPTINALEKDPSVNPQHTQFTQDSVTQKPATAFVSQLILRLKTKHRKVRSGQNQYLRCTCLLW